MPRAELGRTTAIRREPHGKAPVLMRGELDIKTLAAREGVSASWVTRTLRLAFLSPEVTAAILTGNHRSGIDLGALTATDAVQPDWKVQSLRLMPRPM